MLISDKNEGYKVNLILINLLIFIIFPFNLANLENYTAQFNIFLSIFLIAIISSTFLIIFFYILKKIFTKFDIYIFHYFENFIKFSLLWIFLTGMFFPVTGDHDAFLNLSISLGGKFVIILKFLITILIFYILEKTKLSKIFFRFISIYLLINLLIIIINIDFTFYKDKQVDTKINHFGEKNLIVISFDGISDIKMFEEIVSNPELKKSLKDFTYYKDVTSSWPATNGSINAEIIGNNLNFSSTNPDYNNFLNDKKLDVSVYSSYGRMVYNKDNTLLKGGYKNYSNSYELSKYIESYFLGSIGRWATYLSVSLVKPIFYISGYKKFINLVAFNNKNQINPFEKINTPAFIDLLEYDLMFDEIVIDKKLKNTVRMYHFIFSHWPVQLNRNCEEVNNLNNIISYERESEAIKCLSKKINKVVKILKDKNIYDKSMIVFKSDHGKPNYVQLMYSTSFFQLIKEKKYDKFYKNYPYNLTINNSFYWGYGRYKPFVMIKDAKIKRDQINFSDKHIFLHDLSATYCNFFYEEEDCNKYQRNNLALDDGLFKEFKYDIYLPIRGNSFADPSGYKKYSISNKVPLIDSLIENNIKLK